MELPSAVEEFMVYLDEYKNSSPHTLRCRRADMVKFCEHLGATPGNPVPVEAIRREQLMSFLVGMKGKSPWTVRRAASSLGSFFNYAQEIGAIQQTPARHLPLPAVQDTLPIILESDQLTHLIHMAQNPWERTALAILVSTGIRRAELASIRIGDIDLDRGTLLVRGKGNKQRIVPLIGQVCEEVRAFLRYRYHPEPEQPLLAIQPQTVNRMLRRVLDRAGITAHVTPHSLRHTFATHMIRRPDVHIRTVQKLLGHTSAQTTMKYLHSSVEEDRAAVEALALGFGAQEEKRGTPIADRPPR